MGKHWFGDFERAEDAMKIDTATARALTALCRRHRVEYGRAGSYPSAIKMAYTRGRRTHNGMPVHQPKDKFGRVRLYLIWRGESQQQIEEAFAFLLMSGPDEIMLIPDTISSNADILKYKQEDYREDQSSKDSDQEEL